MSVSDEWGATVRDETSTPVLAGAVGAESVLGRATGACAGASTFRIKRGAEARAVPPAETRAADAVAIRPIGVPAAGGELSATLVTADSGLARRRATTLCAASCTSSFAPAAAATTSGAEAVGVMGCSERWSAVGTTEAPPTSPGACATRRATIAGVRAMVGHERALRLPITGAVEDASVTGAILLCAAATSGVAPLLGNPSGAASTSTDRSIRTSGRLSVPGVAGVTRRCRRPRRCAFVDGASRSCARCSTRRSSTPGLDSRPAPSRCASEPASAASLISEETA